MAMIRKVTQFVRWQGWKGLKMGYTQHCHNPRRLSFQTDVRNPAPLGRFIPAVETTEAHFVTVDSALSGLFL
jgi:hypothetical protein